MNAPIHELKAALRREMRQKLAALDPAVRRRDSERLMAWIGGSEGWRSGTAVLAFVAQPSEPDLGPLLAHAVAEGRTVCVPRWHPESGGYEAAVLTGPDALEAGPFGVPEPGRSVPSVPWERLDLILVPGLAFDPLGWRLGRGRGYFDRILTQASSARRWGVAFDFQVVDHVPRESHDVNVHILATPQLGLTAAE